ncbi:hypothetical protein [Microcoleus sp. A006_D1]|uniref:hypothetical protein n=1 Tax=Microcoleus sp. A006_D1 TaxID=3055267 RepID=UPI002FD5D96E
MRAKLQRQQPEIREDKGTEKSNIKVMLLLEVKQGKADLPGVDTILFRSWCLRNQFIGVGFWIVSPR